MSTSINLYTGDIKLLAHRCKIHLKQVDHFSKEKINQACIGSALCVTMNVKAWWTSVNIKAWWKSMNIKAWWKSVNIKAWWKSWILKHDESQWILNHDES